MFRPAKIYPYVFDFKREYFVYRQAHQAVTQNFFHMPSGPYKQNPAFSFLNHQYFFYRLPYYLHKDFFFLFFSGRYNQKFTAINPFIFPFFFIIFYLFISFFFFRDVFLLFLGLPFTENSLRYDWTVASDKRMRSIF
jgi:Zn-dependent protease with chaperone function